MTDPNAIFVTTLREIIKGSSVTGRWIDQINLDAPDDGYDKNAVPQGYYDVNAQRPAEDTLPDDEDWPDYPEGVDDPEDQERLILVKGEWLAPAEWESYTLSDQVQWLNTVAGMARRALEQAGIPAEEPKDEESAPAKGVDLSPLTDALARLKQNVSEA